MPTEVRGTKVAFANDLVVCVEGNKPWIIKQNTNQELKNIREMNDAKQTKTIKLKTEEIVLNGPQDRIEINVHIGNTGEY